MHDNINIQGDNNIINEGAGLTVNSQNRFKSKVLWSTIASALLLLLGEWGLYEAVGIEQELIQHTIDFILLCLVGFGIINNPSDKNNI